MAARLKQQSGGDILIYGCGGLARTLTRHHLIDEFRIWVAPLVVGRGTRLFDDPGNAIALRLTGPKTFDLGTVVLSYEPAGMDQERSDHP